MTSPIDIFNRTKLFTGSANTQLAHLISQHLDTLHISSLDLSQFSDKEIRCEIPEYVRGHHTFVIQPTCNPVNDHLMELLILTDALKRQNVKSITAVIPYWGYARQDRKPGFDRTPITSSLVAKLVETAGVDQIIMVDIHSEQQLGFFNIPIINISAIPAIVADIWRNHHDYENVVVVSPDTGGVVRARSVAKQLDNVPLVIVDKRRPNANESEVMNIIGDVEGKKCIVIDDIIDTAGTLCKAAAALKQQGATKVCAYATHPVFSGNALTNIENSVIDEVVVTNTIPISNSIPKNIRQISIAELLAETIRRLRSHQSVSEIYT